MIYSVLALMLAMPVFIFSMERDYSREPRGSRYPMAGERYNYFSFDTDAAPHYGLLSGYLYEQMVSNFIISRVEVFVYDPETARYFTTVTNTKPFNDLRRLIGLLQEKTESPFACAQRGCREKGLDVEPLALLDSYDLIMPQARYGQPPRSIHMNNAVVFALLKPGGGNRKKEEDSFDRWISIMAGPQEWGGWSTIPFYRYMHNVYLDALSYIIENENFAHASVDLELLGRLFHDLKYVDQAGNEESDAETDPEEDGPEKEPWEAEPLHVNIITDPEVRPYINLHGNLPLSAGVSLLEKLKTILRQCRVFREQASQRERDYAQAEGIESMPRVLERRLVRSHSEPLINNLLGPSSSGDRL
jgi:hypothetical protein